MTKYHVNPETGNPGKCRASDGNCPFGSEDQHYPTHADAQFAYEDQMKELQKFEASPLGKLDAASNKALTALRDGFDNAVTWLDEHPKIVIGGFVVIGIAVGAAIAHKLATNYYASTTSAPFTGTVTEGHTETHVVGIIGKGGHIDTDAVYQVTGPSGEMLEYTTESSQLVPNGTELPLHLYSDGGVHAKSVADEAGPGIAAATVFAGGGLGAVAGMTTGILTSLGVMRIRDYLDARWNQRHESKFGLTNWQSRR